MGTVARMALMAAVAMTCASGRAAAENPNIYQVTLEEPNQKTGEISTEQMQRILVDKSAIVLDSRPRAEFDAGHIPGAQPLDGPASTHVATAERLADGDKSRRLVLYCNGPYCGASKRVAAQLVAAGFSNVQRYQLGMPIWRALGGPTEVELDGIVRIFKNDRTVVYIDARSAEEFAKGSLPGARNLTIENADAVLKRMASGDVRDAPLPLDDFNRRIVLFGRDANEARKLAEILSKKPWHNVAYFPGSFQTLVTALRK